MYAIFAWELFDESIKINLSCFEVLRAQNVLPDSNFYTFMNPTCMQRGFGKNPQLTVTVYLPVSYRCSPPKLPKWFTHGFLFLFLQFLLSQICTTANKSLAVIAKFVQSSLMPVTLLSAQIVLLGE